MIINELREATAGCRRHEDFSDLAGTWKPFSVFDALVAGERQIDSDRWNLRVALHTGRLTDLFRGDSALADHLGECEEVWIPLVVPRSRRALTGAPNGTATLCS